MSLSVIQISHILSPRRYISLDSAIRAYSRLLALKNALLFFDIENFGGSKIKTESKRFRDSVKNTPIRDFVSVGDVNLNLNSKMDRSKNFPKKCHETSILRQNCPKIIASEVLVYPIYNKPTTIW